MSCFGKRCLEAFSPPPNIRSGPGRLATKAQAASVLPQRSAANSKAPGRRQTAQPDCYYHPLTTGSRDCPRRLKTDPAKRGQFSAAVDSDDTNRRVEGSPRAAGIPTGGLKVARVPPVSGIGGN